MRFVTAALLICVGMSICGITSPAQTSTVVPGAPASRAESAGETPRAPVFEVPLEDCVPKSAPARLLKTVRRARAQSCRYLVAASKARVSKHRYKRPPGTG